jgi:hypothetical protein
VNDEADVVVVLDDKHISSRRNRSHQGPPISPRERRGVDPDLEPVTTVRPISCWRGQPGNQVHRGRADPGSEQISPEHVPERGGAYSTVPKVRVGGLERRANGERQISEAQKRGGWL